MADAAAAPLPRRTLSRESGAVPRRASARETASSFADFLSDGSSDDEVDLEDEDDADSRALLRMQQQADDGAYSDAPFKLKETASSFRLTLQNPRDLQHAQDAGPRKLMALAAKPQHEPETAEIEIGAASVDDVLDLVAKAERASRHLSLGASAEETIEPAPVSRASSAKSLRRKTSVRESESAFADFLSDGSNSSDEEAEDDAHTRALLRMQQQADDRAYLDTSLKMERPPVDLRDDSGEGETSNSRSFRLTLAKPGVFATREHDDGLLSGPRKLVAAVMTRASVVTGSEYTKSDEESDGRPSFNDENSFTDANFAEAEPAAEAEAGTDGAVRASDPHESLASRPPSFDEDYGDSFFDEGRPSFSDEPSFSGGAGDNSSFTAADSSFVYRPSLLDDEDEAPTSHAPPPANATSTNSFVDTSFVYRQSVPATDKKAVEAQTQPSSFVDSSFVYRPESENPIEIAKSSIPATEDTSFLYRPTLPDDDSGDKSFAYRPTEEILPGGSEGDRTAAHNNITSNGSTDAVLENQGMALTGHGHGYEEEEEEEEDQPSFLGQSTSNFIRSSDAVDFGFGGIDSSFRLHDADAAAIAAKYASLDSELTDIAMPSKACISECEAVEHVTTPLVEKLTPLAIDNSVPASPNAAASLPSEGTSQDPDHDHDSRPSAYPSLPTQPSLSRHSSVSSTVSGHDGYTRQRRVTSGGSWRVDFRESKHAFDEELAPLVTQVLSPQASALKPEQPSHRLSTFEERASAASSSFSQADFFVDDVQQTFSNESSLSLDSRSSGDDSLTNVAILGDNVGDQNERRSSDIIPQESSGPQSRAATKAPDAFAHSYSKLLAVNVGVDQSFSTLVDRYGLKPDGDYGSVTASAAGTSLGSSLASSAISRCSTASGCSTASDDLPFVSFSAARAVFEGPSTKQKEQRTLVAAAAATATSQETPSLNTAPASKSVVCPPPAKEPKPASPPSVAPRTLGAKKFSSAALLAAIKTRDTRADTRSEETEASDVAPGALHPMAPPLKINLGPRGRGSLSSSPVSGSPLNMSFIARSSGASSTSSADYLGTADRLDFTGVYRGSVNSLEASRNNGLPSTSAQAQAEPKQLNQGPRGDDKKVANKAALLAVKLERSKSDSRAMHLAAQRKVEGFFRRTGEDDIDEREVHRLTTRKTRARTTVTECREDAKAAKIIDLKNLRNGGKRPGWHLQSDASRTRQQEEEASRQGTMGMTSRTTSTGTTATRSIPSEPHNYVLSPQAAGNQPKLEEKASARAPKTGRRADNLSLTPTLARLSANESPSLSASPFVFSHALGAAGRSPGKSPVGFGAASGFLWKTGSGFKGMKRSVAEDSLDASHVTFSQRPTLAERVQSLSASLASTLRRFLPTWNAQQYSGEITSPQSQCTAPAALPRAYDNDGFYETPFKVPGLNKPLLRRRNKAVVESNGAWARQWLILAVCAVLGLTLGAILVGVVAFDSSVFNLSADDVRERRDGNGELVLAAAVRWMLLPGQLFVRVWSAVTTPLLICYVVTAVADLVGCADKAALVLSFRSIWYALLLAALAAAEGVMAMWMTHKFGWFRGSSSSAIPEALTLSAALGVTPLPTGAVGLLCVNDGEYLQRVGDGVFACSNSLLTLPLHGEVSTNSSGVAGSGPAVFTLQEVSDVFATPQSVPYYPASLGSGGNMTASLLSALTPDNLASQFTDVADDEMASMCGLVVFSLLLGYVCGKRILRRRRDGQTVMFGSARRGEDPHQARHYIMSIAMELQLALEGLVRAMERYLAPVGFFSLTLGNVVLHHREWRSLMSSTTSLIVGVLIVVVLHAVLVLPVVLRLFSSRRVPALTTGRAFVPTFLFAFATDSLPLSAPVSMQCYARVLTVTRSAAQLVTAVAVTLTRNARALYLPMLLLWLLETSTPLELHLTGSDFFSVGLMALLSSFFGGSTRVTLALARTLWAVAVSKQAPAAAGLLPPTMPLLVVCDVVLSRVASMVNVADHVVLTHLAAQHWAETVVDGPSGSSGIGISVNEDHEEFIPPSPSALDDSQAPRPSSSAMLSSVYL